jgi:hypothetical protein
MRQTAAGTPEARHAWVEWLGERDAAESLKAMIDGWRRNALQALASHDYRADVGKYLEVSVDARLYLMARPELLRHLEDLEDAEEAGLEP